MRRRPFLVAVLVVLSGSTAAAELPPLDAQFRYRPERAPAYTFFNLDPTRLASGDAVEGLAHILRGDGFSVRMPWKFARSKLYTLEIADQLRQRGNIPSPFDNALNDFRELPLDHSLFAADGTQFVNANCMMCHAAVVGHQVVAGAANKDLNGMRMIEDGHKLEQGLWLALFGLNPVEQAALRGVVANNGSMLGPFFRYATTIGDNQGPFFSWSYAAHLADPATSLDATIGEHEETPLTQLLYGQEHFPTVQSMPWWSIKYRGHHYWYRDSVVDLAQSGSDFAINFSSPDFTGPRRPYAERAAITKSMLAYAYQTQSPPFPRALDAAKVERGRALFHAEVATHGGERAPCAGCHGVYQRTASGWDVSYPRETALHDVGTDPSYNELLRRLEPIAAALSTYYDANGPVPHYSVPQAPGYVAPPLDGVWASAPYFHNGSVPTLEAVLNPDARPEYWAASADPTAYDYGRVGQDAVALTADEVAARKDRLASDPWDTERVLAVQRIYDTHEEGKSNAGHQFGRIFDAQERADVIEFLKALGGPGMRALGAN